ncbi:putative NRPS-like enzyme [Pleurostoma richardsiae]|uniref:NRPS-like enzyme n=1 Tax=Pleurostoma richardsiae TaxID=41990 RepID=A0AA38R859_9PEZI|nr:putative NRPS-like enzyme [Pleurostoma richardsiae]
MGSVQLDGGDLLPLPSTKLPCFNITLLDPDSQPYHETTVNTGSINTGALLQRFASFIGAVTEADRVVFVADTTRGRTLVDATVVSPGGIARLQHIPAGRADVKVDDFDFAIRLVADDVLGEANGIARDKLPVPFILSVELSKGDGSANLTLSLRGDHGSLTAAQHLLRLAASYLSTGTSGHNTEPSRIVTVAPTEGSVAAQRTLMHEWFEDSARRRPDNIAAEHLSQDATSVYHRRDLTYGELDALAEQVADAVSLVIPALDWKPLRGDQRVVPLFLPSGPDFLVGSLGIQKAGHAFCPLPLDAPAERLRVLIDDVQAPAVFGVGNSPWADTKELRDVLWVDMLAPEAWRTTVAVPDGPLVVQRRAATPDDLAYVLYTSGSTGKPKGVLIPHAAGACFLDSITTRLAHLPTGPRLRWFATSQPTFDAHIFEAFPPLALGGTVCTAERNLMLTDVEAAVDALRATAAFFVPSLAMLLRPARVPTLRTLFVGGEMLSQRVVDNFAAASAPATAEAARPDDRYFLNCYGPTEVTVWVSTQYGSSATRRSVVGDPFPRTTAFLLDPDSDAPREVALGLPGELALGGPQVAQGYLNRPHETARAFVDSPALGGRLYRTGDKVRIVWDEDGQPKLDFLGRFSADQVKLNGRRVELPEVETVLARLASVAEVTVLVAANQLVAYVVGWASGGDAAAEMEHQCRAEAERCLPAWMRPRRYWVLQALPRTVNGKVDRKPLVTMAIEQLAGKPRTNGLVRPNGPVRSNGPAPKPADPETARAPESPPDAMTNGNEKETASSPPPDTASIVYRALATALDDTDVLDREGATPLANLGFDSLRAMAFLQRLRSTGVSRLAIQDILPVTSIDGLIKVTEARRAAQPASAEENTAARPDGGHAPLADNVTHAIDVTAIAVDDEEAVYELPVEAKLRHFAHYCRPGCLEALGLPAAEVEQVLPATNLQVRFLTIATTEAFLDPARYWGKPEIEHYVYEVPDALDPARLQRAVAAVLARYDCFRAVFVPVRHPLSTFAQCVLAPSAAAIPVVETVCPARDSAQPDSLWRRTVAGTQRAAEEAMRLDRPGVAVAYVWSPDRARCVLVLSLFHALYDGVSLTYLREAIAAEYYAALPVAYLPVRTAVEGIMGADWTGTMLYWMARFANVPVFRLGPARPGPVAGATPYSASGETHMRSLFVVSRLTLQELSARVRGGLGASLIAVVEAAYASVLAQTWRGASEDRLDVQFGCVMNGRQTDAAQRCMAAMMAMAPVHLVVDRRVSPPRTNRETCRALVAQHQDAAPHLQAPCPTRDLAELAMNRFDTVLNVHAYVAPARDLPGFNAEENLRAPFKEIDTGFPLLVELWPARGDWGEKIVWKAVYNARRPGYEFLTDEWAASALAALDEALLRILDDPDAPFS